MSAKEDKTLETYDNEAAAWNKLHGNSRLMSQHFERFRRLLPSGHILDIGCGTGKDAELFLDGGHQYTGIDASLGMLQIARRSLPQVKFVKMNMRDLAAVFPPQYFDGFWASASLLHIPKIDMADVLRQIAIVVKSGGYGFISVKEGAGEEIKTGSLIKGERFFANYTMEELMDILENNGFETIAGEKDFRKCRPPENTVWLALWVRLL